MNLLRHLAVAVALAASAHAQQLVSNPTFQGTAQSNLNMGGHAITNSTISKDQVGLGSVENTPLSTWPGSGNLTTVGTITSGTWHGSQIDSSRIFWPISLNPTASQLNDSGGRFSMNWNSRILYNMQTMNNGATATTTLLNWSGNGNSFLYSFDYQPLDGSGDDGTLDNNGVKYLSKVNPLLNIGTGDIYGWVTDWSTPSRYTAINGNLLNSELYSDAYTGDGIERYRSLNWANRVLYGATSAMGDVSADDPIQISSISVDWGNRTLETGLILHTQVEYPGDPGDPQDYAYWGSTLIATWQGGLHAYFLNYGSSAPVGMRYGMTYSNSSPFPATFVLPKNAAPGAIFTIVDKMGGGFIVAQQDITPNSSYPDNVMVRMGSNVTTQGSAGSISCGPYSVISLMAVEGFYYGGDYTEDDSGGYNATRHWIVASYSLGTPTFH